MPDLAIIADDLTGALDAAAPFAGHENGVAVATHPGALAAVLRSGAGVVSVSTRSREIAGDEAQRRVAAVLAGLPPGLRLFKKIDSRLKGNIADELAAFSPGAVFVAPAIPDLGRVVRDGHVVGAGVAEAIAVRPRLGPAAARASIPDTESNEDMARALAGAGAQTLLVGARGLAQALARTMELALPPAPPALPGPLCIVVGSIDPITRAQVAALKAAREDLDLVAAPAGRVAHAPAGPIGALTLVEALPGGSDPPPAVAARFATGVAAWAGPALSLVLTGGATAETVLDTLGIDVLTVVGEALAGMPYCRSGDRIVVTKSGGFGDADALVRLAAGAIPGGVA